MTQPRRRSILPFVTTGLVFGSMLAAWLRFDAGSAVMSWSVVLISIAGALAGWIFQSKRVPHIDLPREVQELGNREELTPEEDAQFADALRAWHRHQQLEAWREIDRDGPGPLISTRAALYYLWLSLFALALLPPMAVPSMLFPGLPRFVLVLVPLAAVAIAAAVPLGIRDWRRARKALRTA